MQGHANISTHDVGPDTPFLSRRFMRPESKHSTYSSQRNSGNWVPCWLLDFDWGRDHFLNRHFVHY